jgi:hypothetical protein
MLMEIHNGIGDATTHHGSLEHRGHVAATLPFALKKIGVHLEGSKLRTNREQNFPTSSHKVGGSLGGSKWTAPLK